MEKTDDKSAEAADSERIRKIHECVKRIKSSEEMGVKYMQAWEEKIMEREKGRQEGREEGRADGKVAGKAESVLEILEEYGEVPDELRDRVLAQRDLEILKSWLKVANKVGSIEEFAEKISQNEALEEEMKK